MQLCALLRLHKSTTKEFTKCAVHTYQITVSVKWPFHSVVLDLSSMKFGLGLQLTCTVWYTQNRCFIEDPYHNYNLQCMLLTRDWQQWSLSYQHQNLGRAHKRFLAGITPKKIGSLHHTNYFWVWYTLYILFSLFSSCLFLGRFWLYRNIEETEI